MGDEIFVLVGATTIALHGVPQVTIRALPERHILFGGGAWYSDRFRLLATYASLSVPFSPYIDSMDCFIAPVLRHIVSKVGISCEYGLNHPLCHDAGALRGPSRGSVRRLSGAFLLFPDISDPNASFWR